MKLKQRLILGLLAVVLVVGAGIFEFSGHKAQASLEDTSTLPVVAVQLATRGPIQSFLTLSGEFRPYQEVDVHAKVAGYIRRIYVDVGDKVREGQALAILEVPELNAQVTAAFDLTPDRLAIDLREVRDEMAPADAVVGFGAALFYVRGVAALLERSGHTVTGADLLFEILGLRQLGLVLLLTGGALANTVKGKEANYKHKHEY